MGFGSRVINGLGMSAWRRKQVWGMTGPTWPLEQPWRCGAGALDGKEDIEVGLGVLGKSLLAPVSQPQVIWPLMAPRCPTPTPLCIPQQCPDSSLMLP